MVEENNKIPKFDFQKRSRFIQFYYFLRTLLYHGWRKFWNLTSRNAPDWFNFTSFWEHYFTMVEEKFEIWLPKTLQIWFNFTISWRMCKMLFHIFLQSAKNASLILYDFAPPTSLMKNLPPLCQKSTPPASLMTCPPCLMIDVLF